MALWTHQDAFTVGHDAALRGDNFRPIGEAGELWFEAYSDGFQRGMQEKAAK